MYKRSKNGGIQRFEIINGLGNAHEAKKCLRELKRRDYFIERGLGSMGGAAPKDFIKVYLPSDRNCKRTVKSTWIPYIAKAGIKYYPNESITEQLISDIGRWCHFSLADSELLVIAGQIRFCSRFFLKKGWRLVHGAEIYSRVLDDDFVNEIEKRKKEPQYFDYQFSQAALREMFPVNIDGLKESFLLMLLFDAFVGNNDRHMYNWGVIVEVRTNKCLGFSPIYDSARGLLWNTRDDEMGQYWKSKAVGTNNEKLEHYARNAKPRIGVSTKEQCSHFELMAYLCEVEDKEVLDKLRVHFDKINIFSILDKIDQNYLALFNRERLETIKALLKYRHEQLLHILA